MVKKQFRFSAEIFLAFLFTLFFSQIVFAQPIASLEPNQPLEREISGGQKHEYQIAFAAGQYAKILIEQRGINVGARVLSADGKVLGETDYEQRSAGVETIEMFSAADGNLRLIVESRQKSDRQAAYQINLVERRAATEKEIAVDEAKRFITTANRLWLDEKYAEALPLAERSLEIRRRELGEENSEVGRAYFILANIVSSDGDLAKSELFYGRALEISEKALGKDHLFVSSILNNWGIVYKDRGDYIRAEAFYARALEVRQKVLDANHLLIASSLNNLGNISNAKGDTEKAAEYYRRALSIRENALGTEHPDVATLLNNLANLSDDFATVEPLHLRVLAIREKNFGLEHLDVAQTLYNLARLYASQNDYAKAEPLCLRALSIYEKKLGAEHYYNTFALNMLGVIYKGTEQYAKSETFFLRAAALKEKMQSPLHPELGGIFVNLADLYGLLGETEKAVAAQTRANEILEYNTRLNLNAGSERQKLDYLQTFTNAEYQSLTLNFGSPSKPFPAATELAATSVLRLKGRAFDAMSNGFAALRGRFDKQDQALFDDFNEATARLVNFVMVGGDGISSDEYRKKIKTLEQKREAIENQISRRSAGFYERDKSVTLDIIKAAIPINSALVEFVVYRPVNFETTYFATTNALDEKRFGKPHYAVFVVSEKGETQSIDLGETEKIDAAIEDWRKALRDPKRADVRALARSLDEKIMKPVRALTGDAKSLLISPDGALNLIPFEALVDEKENYLIENFSISYLTSGRDLLRMQSKRDSRDKSLIVANPSFGKSSPEIAANGKTSSKEKSRRSVTATRDLSETYFAPLAATLSEARSIQEQFPAAIVLTGTAANETALKQMRAPRVLHIATHGFFLENLSDLNSDLQKKRGSKIKNETDFENPLLRSGIALAGANERKNDGTGDGILTALEASGLNLWGTKLVVLSACDTGLGEVKNGEGVYGLRRAFTLAGTESLVMSLWAVSDYATRELMIDYYKNLKNGIGRGESLRLVKLAMMKKKTRQHPFYWAGFIQSGEWANLEGKR